MKVWQNGKWTIYPDRQDKIIEGNDKMSLNIRDNLAAKSVEVEKKNETLTVEFEVLKTFTKPYGFEEKLIRFRGSDTRYKAITKNKQLVAILGRFYQLIPNEDVEDKVRTLAAKDNMEIQIIPQDWRLYALLKSNDVGVMVSNSVDGTTALRCDAILYNNGNIIMPSFKHLKNIYKKHSKELNIKDLDKEIDEIFKISKKYKEWFESLDNVKVEPYLNPLREMFKTIPQKYIHGVLEGYYFNNSMSLKQVYEKLSSRIWQEDTDIRTKITLFRKINDCLAAIGVVDML